MFFIPYIIFYMNKIWTVFPIGCILHSFFVRFMFSGEDLILLCLTDCFFFVRVINIMAQKQKFLIIWIHQKNCDIIEERETNIQT